MPQTTDIVDLDAIDTLAALLSARVERSPEAIAYRYYHKDTDEWTDIDWEQFTIEVCRWQAALLSENFDKGERVAIMAANSPEWAAFDIAAQGLGLVLVPLYVNDRAENISLVVEDCGARLLLIGGPEQWRALEPLHDTLSGLKRVVALNPVQASASGLQPVAAQDWLPANHDALRVEAVDSNALATIVYTSGTTGRPKGVMLSHRNILFNVQGVLERVRLPGRHVPVLPAPVAHAGTHLRLLSADGRRRHRSLCTLGKAARQAGVPQGTGQGRLETFSARAGSPRLEPGYLDLEKDR